MRCTTTRTGCGRRSCGATASWWRSPGTRRSPRSSERLPALIAEHGRDAVAVYAGQPVGAQHWRSGCTGRRCYKALGTKNFYTRQHGRPAAQALLGRAHVRPRAHDPRAGPRPDRAPADARREPAGVQRQPDDRAGRARPAAALRERGGKLVVVDPKRSRTAELADEHHAIRPGTDALLLFALVNVLFAEDLVNLRDLPPSTGSTRCGRWPSRSPRRRWRPATGSPRTRSADGPRPGGGRAAPRCTAGSAPPRKRSARSRAG